MTRIITLNLNGIRSAAKKGFFSWLSKENADVVCLQETRAHPHQLIDSHFKPEGYHVFSHEAEKKGYSGVAIYTKLKPDKVHYGLGWKEADIEGRYLQVDFNNISIASLYLPSGTSGAARQAFKYTFLERYQQILLEQRKTGREYILCGDWNIAHKNIDIKNWKSNQKNSGFLPEERAWLDNLFGPMGYVDAFRVVNQSPDQYTWWSQRANARANNVGWRIDYQIITPGLSKTIKAASIYNNQIFSDHAPLIMDYNLKLAASNS